MSRLVLFLIGIQFTAIVIADEESGKRPPRKFNLIYGAKIIDAPESAEIKVWLPIAQTNSLQKIEVVESNVPSPLQINSDSKHGNRIGFFKSVSKGKPIEFQLSYRVERREARPGMTKEKLTADQKQEYLKANDMVPVNGKPVELIKDRKLPNSELEIGQELYNVVEAYMTYDKSNPGYGNGDVIWACSSKTGNCTDFHSLFISLARSQNIPAKFEIGFPIPAEKKSGTLGGYHCWAWFYTDDQGWIAVDISEADKHPEMKEYYFGKLTPDRVAFSSGRDIELIPKAATQKLNYFVYPHVEVDGKQWPKEKIKLKLEFRDQG